MLSLKLQSKALWALSSVLLGGALLVSGCGGGGSGPSTPTPTATNTATPTPTIPGLVFADEFNAGSLDRGKWAPLDRTSTLQRTEFGNQPDFNQDTDGTKFMRVKIDTYLPDDAARAEGKVQFYGTEVVAKSKVPRGTGIEFQARMRMSNPERTGLVGAFFLFGSKGTFGGTQPLSFDEIDHELLTNAFATNPPYTWTNIYNDFRVPQPGVPGGDSYFNTDKQNGLSRPLSLVPDFDGRGWNLYRIVWRPGSVQWFINDHPIWEDKSGRVPDDDLGVRFNLWAAKDWAAAFSNDLKPAATAAENQSYSLDVDWVRVRTLDSTTTSPIRLKPLTTEQILRGGPGAGYRSSALR